MRKFVRITLRSTALLTVIGLFVTGCGEQAPSSEGGPVAMSRLTQAQYRQTIADIFGADVQIFGQFEPDYRRDHLLSIGSAWSSVTPAGLEQYEVMAQGIAAQVLDPQRRDRFVPCQPASALAADDDCASQFLHDIGRQLLRRPLTEADVQPRVDVAREAGERLQDFYAGLEFALTSFLLSPEFLFRVEIAEPDPDQPDTLRLNAYTKAARLSYLLWNTTPDKPLLDAAERGDLHTARGLESQVERLLQSPNLERGVRALFADMLEFERFDEVAKDASIYPAYNSAAAADAQEQTLRTITQHLITRNGDYRDLFILREYPMTRALGRIYGVPVKASEGWETYRFDGDADRAGILGQVSLLALHSHPGRSSPTLRGKFIRETFMCQQVPPPPADVDFTMDASFDVLKTARARLERHRTDPTCNGCHRLMDPIGLTLEKLDGIGAFRTRENGEPIDTSGSLDGVEFTGAVGLGDALHANPTVTSCLVNTVYRYALGRTPVNAEQPFMQYLEQQFSETGYRLPDLLRMIAISEAFYSVSALRDIES